MNAPKRSRAAVALRAERIKRRLVQTEAALRIGMDPMQYNKYEKGRKRPSLPRAQVIEQLFGVPVAWWDEEPRAREIRNEARKAG